jgi:hypothetical protein
MSQSMSLEQLMSIMMILSMMNVADWHWRTGSGRGRGMRSPQWHLRHGVIDIRSVIQSV